MVRPVALATGTVLGSLLLTTTPGSGARQPRLVVLVTVDTLRADRLGAYGSTLGLTPHIDRLASEGQVFTTAFAPAPATLPSIAALMTSRYPEELGVTSNSSTVPASAPRLARFLRERGWATGAVVSNYVLRRRAGLVRGFARYDARVTQREGQRAVRERRGPQTTRDALQLLEQLARGGAPVFLWVHYQDPHGPYVPSDAARARTLEHERAAPDGRRDLPLSASQSGAGALPRYQEVDGARQVAFYRAGYNGEVSVVDDEVGRLLAGLSRRGQLDRAVVLFAADHGESLGEDDYWFAHGDRLGAALVHVPLVVRVPGRAPARHAELASLLDIFPTIAAIAGGPPPQNLRGRDLLSDAPGAAAVYLSTLATAPVARHGVVSDGYRYVRWEDLEGAHERLHALDGDATDRAPDRPPVLHRLRGRLVEVRASLDTLPGAPRQSLGAEEVERLTALGYVSTP